MLKTSILCSEGSYPFQLQCFNKHTRVIKLVGHKIYCKLKVYESQYKQWAKIYTEKLIISKPTFTCSKSPVETLQKGMKNVQS